MSFRTSQDQSIPRASHRGGYAVIPGAGTGTLEPDLHFSAAAFRYMLLWRFARRATLPPAAWS